MPSAILFLAPQPYFRLRGICIAEQICLEVLSARGDAVDVLTFPFGADPEPLPGVRIRRVPALPGVRDVPIGPSVRKLLMDLWSLPWIAGRLLSGGHRFVHACEESAFLAALLKPCFGFRLVYDMDDVLSLRLRRSGFLRRRALLRWVAALERFTLRSADVVVTNSQETRRFALRTCAPERVVFYDHAPAMPAAISGHRAPAAELEALRRRWDLAGRKFILYAGNLEPYQGVDLLMDSLPAVLRSVPEALCVVIGGQEEQIAALRRRCAALGTGASVRCLGPRPFPETFLFMQAADVLVSPMTQKKAVPMKLYAYVGSGTPIVATDLPNHRELLDHGSAVLVPPLPDALAEGLLRILRGGGAPGGAVPGAAPSTSRGGGGAGLRGRGSSRDRARTSAWEAARLGLEAAYAAAAADTADAA